MYHLTVVIAYSLKALNGHVSQPPGLFRESGIFCIFYMVKLES